MAENIISQYQMGVDIGSTTIKVALLKDGNVIFSRYSRHRSDIRGELKKLFVEVGNEFKNVNATISISGSGGLSVAKILDLDFVQEVLAGTEAVRQYHENTDVVIELGGEDAKITYMRPSLEQRMNGTCAGGTGAFLDQMASLLKTDAKGLNELAKKHKKIYPIASRCGVFAKSDIQPLLNEGAASEDLAASVLQSVVNQTIAGLAQGRQIKGNIVFLGGPLFFMSQLRKQFELTLQGEGQSFYCPENAQVFVAIGAAMLSKGEEINISTLADRLDNASAIKEEITRIRPLFNSMQEKNDFYMRHNGTSISKADISAYEGEIYLGMDIGSTTIKSVALSEQGEILYSYYGPNQGDPINYAVLILKELYSKMNKNAKIVSGCTTGYGEALIKTALNIPFGEIETLAHFKAADYFCPGVEFIIDIGGQDMKCMKIKDGAIESIMLNEACSSGCGSFIQTFAQSLGLETSDFAKEALNANSPVDLGTRCTVFMNSRVKQAQKEGATVGDISAGLSYSVVRNALYKVIKLKSPEDLGKKVVVQGGTFYNDAILRCFELICEREVIRPDIAGLMGAFGAALIAKENKDKVQSQIISAEELEKFSFSSEFLRCELCSNRCQLTKSSFSNGLSLISGNRCERGSGVEISNEEKLPDLFDYKYKRTFRYKSLAVNEAKYGEIGIPRALNMYEDYPLWHTLLTSIGFKVVISGRSDHRLFEKGMDTIPSESVCYPAKLSHGHIADLLDKGIKTIFYPCVPYEQKEYDGANNHFNCPIVTSYPEVLINNFEGLRENGVKFFHPFVNIGDKKSFIEQIYLTFKEYGVTKQEVKKATELAFKEFAAFKADIRAKGEQTIEWLKQNNKKGIVLAGRPYHVDPEVNHGIPKMITSLGFAVLTEDSVAHLGNMKRPIRVVDQWMYHTRLYEAAAFVIGQENLELIQLNSFGCGLDAVTIEQVQEIITSKGKLYTVLKIDEISNLGTAKIRLRSLKAAINERSKNNFKPAVKEDYAFNRVLFTDEMRKNHTIIAPQMAPIHFNFIEKALQNSGYNALVLKEATADDIETGLKFVNNDACYPTIMVVGQLVNAFLQGKCDPNNTSVIITQTGGGCRATNYIAFLRKALKDAGYAQVPVVSLSMSGLEKNPGLKFNKEFFNGMLQALVYGDLLQTLLMRVRPYEVIRGSANKLYENWNEQILQNMSKQDPQKRSFKRMISEMVDQFDRLEIYQDVVKPKVGLVGEILVKFHPDANNDVIGVIEKEGGEAVMPGLFDFIQYCLYNQNFKSYKLGFSKFNAHMSNLGIWALERYRLHMKKVLSQYDKFAHLAPKHINQIAHGAEKILQLGNMTGEGWFLTGEMVELIENGVPNIVCMQPFACLPNHVTGKGMIKELRKQYPLANIVPIDYDPGASEVNQLNRIKLMISTAFNNLEKQENQQVRMPKVSKKKTKNIKKHDDKNQEIVM